jgi:hypothetical protein
LGGFSSAIWMQRTVSWMWMKARVWLVGMWRSLLSRQFAPPETVAVEHNEMAFNGLITVQQRKNCFCGLLRRSRYESDVDDSGWTGAPAPEDQFTEVAVEGQQAALFVVRCL